MKKILLILITIFITTNVFAHSTKNITPNMDSKKECRKKKSALNYISKHKPNILLVPGASFESKMYPLGEYAKISNKINGNFIILWGSPSERLIAEKIKLLAPEVLIVDKLSLDKLKALISNVDLVIGSDTGPVHMAWALNKASITLFGPTPGYRNSYITNINRVIESNSKVNPYKIDKNDYSIKEIQVEDIVEVSESLLDISE